MEFICRPKKVQIYVANCRKTIAQVKAETGCDAVINGGLYNMSNTKPVCRLRVDGKTLADDGYKYWGYGWNTTAPVLTEDLNAYDNYICCVNMVKNHNAQTMYVSADLKGSRQRTAIGTFDDGRIWLFAQQTPALTPEQLQSYALSIGVKDAVMLDGGASTQCIVPDGVLTSSRKVHNYICVWKEDENKPMLDIEYIPIAKSDVWSSTRTIGPSGIVLHSTAMPGYGAYAIQQNFNRANRGASIHGCIDDEHIVQCLPWTKRAGHVGSGKNGSFNNSHIGIELCEPKGLTYNKNGSVITAYNPPAGYFAKVWKNAVDLFAYLCKQYNLNPLGKNVIVCHCEAHALGYGDNHADVMHWFKWENKTMDDFRQAVYQAMQGEQEEEEVTYEQWKEYMEKYMAEAVISEPSKWAKAACEKAITNGIMQGDGSGAYNFQKPLTREAYLVMQDRQGLLDK